MPPMASPPGRSAQGSPSVLRTAVVQRASPDLCSQLSDALERQSDKPEGKGEEGGGKDAARDHCSNPRQYALTEGETC